MEEKKEFKDLRVDIGVDSREEAEKVVDIGFLLNVVLVEYIGRLKSQQALPPGNFLQYRVQAGNTQKQKEPAIRQRLCCQPAGKQPSEKKQIGLPPLSIEIFIGEVDIGQWKPYGQYQVADCKDNQQQVNREQMRPFHKNTGGSICAFNL